MTFGSEILDGEKAGCTGGVGMELSRQWYRLIKRDVDHASKLAFGYRIHINDAYSLTSQCYFVVVDVSPKKV